MEPTKETATRELFMAHVLGGLAAKSNCLTPEEIAEKAKEIVDASLRLWKKTK